MLDYIVIGAGFAGSVIAERIANQLNKKVLIIEERNHIGGNCYDSKGESNVIVHKYGPHLFHTENDKVFKYLSRFTNWEIYHHKVKAMINGKMVNIPFNFNTIHEVFPASLAKKLEAKLLEEFEYNTKIPILELKKSKDKDLQFLADFVYEKIFVHYTAKQWGLKPEEMDGAVTARVPILIGRDDRYFNDKFQAMPQDGYTKIFDKMLDHKNIKLLLNTSFSEACELKDGDIYFLGKKFEGKVIYTGLIDQLFGNKYGDLPYRSIDMKFETVSKEYYQNAAVENYPNNYDFTRITEFKHMHPCKSDKTVILKEYPEDFVPGKNIPYYPVFTATNQEKYQQYSDLAKSYSNLILVGRLAEYKYYDMDDIVERALNVFEEKLTDTLEIR